MKQRSPRPHGFTLVEVTIALGLISFSLLTLIGLLPTGLRTLGNSMDQTLHAQIVQRIASDLRVSDFASYSAAPLFFDADGQSLTSSGGARFQAAVNDAADPSMPGVSLPEDVEKLKANLKRVNIVLSRVDIPNATPTVFSMQIAPIRKASK